MAAAAAFPFAALALWAPQAYTDILTSRGYMPHGHCYLWQPRLVALHGASDLIIGISYLAISSTLAYLVYRARDHIPFQWMIVAFGLFIVACGMTHFIEVLTLWTPLYWLSGDVKVVTALASAGTAVALPPLIPHILDLVRARDLAAERELALEQSAALLGLEQKARAKAEEADRAKDQFLALVSHELRTPLSPILAWSRMLKLGTLSAEDHAAAVQAIERNATAQAQLIEDLLDVSRIVSGKLRLDVRPTALSPVIEAAVDSLRPSADAKQIRLQFGRSNYLMKHGEHVRRRGMEHHVRDHDRAVCEMLRVARKAILISDSNNFGQGGPLTRALKQGLHAAGLRPMANLIKTRGKGYSLSEGDGLFYSYSVFDDYPRIRDRCRSVHVLNTVAAGIHPYRTSGHVALLGIKERAAST